MKKKFKISILIIIIFVPAIWLIFFNNTETNPSKQFITDDTSMVHKVKISKGHDKILLTKNATGNEWKVNNKYYANKKSINKLMQTLKETKIFAPVKKEENASVMKKLEQEGTSVIIYDKKENILRNWLVGSSNDSIHGTFMVTKEMKQAYIVNIPGLEINLNKRYNSNTIYWITPNLFSYKPSDIKEITVRYFSRPENSFQLQIDNETATIYSFSSNKYIKNININKVGSYLSYFMNIKFSSLISVEEEIPDTLVAAEPEYQISVKDINNLTKDVKFYLIRSNTDPQNFDLNQMKATVNNEDVVYVKFFEIDLILKDINYFIN